MDPSAGRYFALRRQLDHVHRWLVAASATGSASERPFKFPDRRIARAPDGIERDAGAGLTAIALDFHPTVPPLRHCAIVGEGCAGAP
jgi:hypothetical protein